MNLFVRVQAAPGHHQILLLAVGLVVGARVEGADWPQYRGPNHDGVSSETIRTDWSAQSPEVIWRVPLAPGLSSFAISAGRAYTQVRRNIGGLDQEVCIALDANNGQELWATPMGKADYPNGGVGADDGPRSTPSVDGDRVYVLSSYLLMACLDASNGQPVWTNDLVKTYGGVVIPWQNAASPLVEGDLVILNCNAVGRTLLALHKSDGSVAWQGQSDSMTQATPVAATIQGTRQVVFFAQSGLVSVDPTSGDVLWRYPVAYNGTSVAASPVVAGDLVYCSRAYPVKAGAVTVQVGTSGAGLVPNRVWARTNQLLNHWCTPVQVNGYLFGHYGQGVLSLECVDMATGVERWSRPGFGYGSVVAVGGNVLALSDTGDLALVAPDPTAYTEIARFKALSGKCWNVVAISNGRIYARSTTEGVCLDVSIPAAVQVSTTSLPDGMVGAAYSTPLLASGGQTPYGWALAPGSGALPMGLDLSADGLLAGTPLEAGAFNFTVRVTDASAATADTGLALMITSPPLAVLTGSLPDGLVGANYYVQLQASGGIPPYHWSLSTNSSPLVPGLLLSTGGLLSGIPGIDGTNAFEVTVADAAGTAVTRSLSMTVAVLHLNLLVQAQSPETILRDGFRFVLAADSPGSYVIDYSGDLIDWTEWKSVEYTSGSLEVTDAGASNALTRYYRVHR